MKKIDIVLYAKYDEVNAFLNSTQGISYQYVPKMAYDSAIDGAKIIELSLSFASQVAVGVFSSWLYDKLKSNNKFSVSINSKSINREDISVEEINAVLNHQINKKYDVFGIGNALVDKEFEVSDDFLAAHSIAKGMMSLIDEPTQLRLLDNMKQTFGLKKRASGGSAANTIVAVSQFGGKTFYACKVANDEAGEFYMNDLHAAGVVTGLNQVRSNTEGVTGKCLVMVTPDAERTMNTFLGITADFSENELHLDELKQAQYLYIEGYLVTSDISRAAAMKARAVAKAHGVKTAMTFSDPAMVKFFREGVNEMLGEGADILFCNEEEITAFTGEDDLERAIVAIKPFADKLVVTLGEKGAWVVDDLSPAGRTVIAPNPVRAIDSNGAGDMFAGAFMYGITQGMDNATAGRLASLAASKIVTVFGARLSAEEHAQVLASL